MQQLVPPHILLEYTKSLILYTTLSQLIWITTRWYAKQNITIIFLNIEQVDIPCRRHQSARVVINVIPHSVVAAIWITQRLEQGCLTILAVCEQLNHLFRLTLFCDNWTILSYDLFHTSFQLRYHLWSYLFGHFTRLADSAIKTTTYRVLKTQVATWP